MTETTERLLQYATSTDPDVVSAIERNTEGRKEFIARVNVFVREHDGQEWTPGGLFGAHHVLAMHRADGTKPPGWVTGPSGVGGLRPRKKTALWDEWDSLEFHEEPVPGLAEAIRLEGGVFRVQRPVRFVLDGVAWAGLSATPRRDQDGGALWGEEWSEIKGSEFLRALEIYNDRVEQEGEA